MKVTQTAIVDLEAFNAALMRVQMLSGEVSFLKVYPIIQAFQQCVVPPPSEDKDECPSPTPQKSSSRKSETNTK